MKSKTVVSTDNKTTKRKIERGSKLSHAEEKILRLISLEKTTRQIAEELELSPKTVENHRGNICKRLGITGTSALLKYALRTRQEI